MLTSPGRMRDRLEFQSREVVDDGFGNRVGEWTPRFTRWAEVRPLKGDEAVIGSRLQGLQPARIAVYSDSSTRAITSDWRAVDVRSGVVWAIKAVIDEERQRRILTLDVVAGEAQ